MRVELIPLPKYKTESNPILLDDYESKSYAIYQANNPDNKNFIYYKPDETHSDCPNCDYLLISMTDNIIRFIELKGADKESSKSCCREEWNHAFHQLACTFDEYKEYIDFEKDSIVFILCTSIIKRRIAAKYTKYKWYRAICETKRSSLKVLYRDDIDEV